MEENKDQKQDNNSQEQASPSPQRVKVKTGLDQATIDFFRKVKPGGKITATLKNGKVYSMIKPLPA